MSFNNNFTSDGGNTPFMTNSFSRNITLGTTYYNCPALLKRFVAKNIEYVDELIVVDDGSDIPAENVLNASPKLKLYRVKKDIGFNSHGCRNLIVNQSSNEWITLIDVDREFRDPEYAYNQLKTRKLSPDVRYLFMLHYRAWGNRVHSGVNDFCINKELFHLAGGYDEELVGIRTGDRQFFRQLLAAGGRELILHDIDLAHTRKATILIQNNDRILSSAIQARGGDRGTLMSLVADRMITPDPNKPTLQFEWYRVF